MTAAALKWSTSLFEVETQETVKSMQINHLDWVSFKGDLLVTAEAFNRLLSRGRVASPG